MSMAAGICAIVEAILRDEHSVMTVAANGDYLGVDGIALSVPTKLSRAGVEHLKAWLED
jgi:L-lactate dehydrogenase